MGIWRVFAYMTIAGVLHAQQTARVCVRDAAGAPIAGAVLTSSGPTTRTDGEGCAVVGPGTVSVAAAGFATKSISVGPGGHLFLFLRPEADAQSVTVTADRGLAGINDAASSVAVLSQRQLEAAPALTLDDRLHQVAGFQLFRRTSSWTANPTTEGASLRGLGSTAASRTLVVSDQVPLNDPFGGWVHWDEIPSLSIQDVQLIRGGSADLYGSSAIGGVIDIAPVEPRSPHVVHLRADGSGGSENSALAGGLIDAASAHAAVLAAGSELKTGGYIPTAPPFRGSVDTPANVNAQSGRLELRTQNAARATAFLRGNVLQESRSNGTPLQTNATRLWRYNAGGDRDFTRTHAALRLYGAHESYRQSFSSIAPGRNSERLTRLQQVPTNEFGFTLQGTHAFGAWLTGAVGVDLRDVRATDSEAPVVNGIPAAAIRISARQRETGGFIDAIWQPRGWSVSGSVRVDSFRTFDAQESVTAKAAPARLPEIDEMVATPRLGVVRRLPHGIALTATAFRAFRGPTMNELYRTGQVGQQTTLANNTLRSERATGFEAGAEFGSLRASGHELGHLRATYFWTEVNRPISAVVLAQTATTETLQRQNLGQIRSRGLMLEAQSARWRGLDGSLGYQLAVATVTAFNTSSPFQKNLTGKWIPQVPRQAVTATANYAGGTLVNLHLIASYTGQQFDDAENRFLLHPYARFDVSADRELGHGLSVFAGAQNLLDRAIEAGRTPLLTLAAPRLIQGGLRYTFRQ